ncbi:MAG: family 43 glycosylhydrolase [Pirellulales bacterium]|nr:family 43 glycosylhydrolase [Pirellulales bacterium]
MSLKNTLVLYFAVFILTGMGHPLLGADAKDCKSNLVPRIEGPWWQVAGNPDLGDITSPKQEPVDFAVWQAADGTWQLWSCIRNTNCGGHTRVFHGWEGRNLTDKNWKPLGIMMEAKPELGESLGGLQAPYVIRRDGKYYMFYGDWCNICLATSRDGKKFHRQILDNGKTGMFNEGKGELARDPMVLQVGDKYHCYYTAHSSNSPPKNHRGVNYCRISSDLRNWGSSKIVAEGSAYKKGPYSAECPHVVYHPESKCYFLFNTQVYGEGRHSTVYRSADPLYFGINDKQFEVATLPVAAPEIILHDGKYYIASLMPTLKGIHIARLKWVAKGD